MIAVLDAAYDQHASVAAAVLAQDWRQENPSEVGHFRAPPAAAYQAGSFYLRELPLLRGVVERLAEPPDCIVVDGYVWLDGAGSPGLGARLHCALGGSIPVVGIAKTQLANDTWSGRVLRGRSEKPLFVTSIGIAQQDAARRVGAMAGAHRLPSLVVAADHAARQALSACS